VLAYARDARQELEDRIAARIGVRVDVRTFHSLSMAIVGEATGRKPTVSKVASDQKELDRRLARYLDDALLASANCPNVLPARWCRPALADWSYQPRHIPAESDHGAVTMPRSRKAQNAVLSEPPV